MVCTLNSGLKVTRSRGVGGCHFIVSLSLSPLMRETGYQLTIRKTRLNVGVLAAKDQHPMLAE